MFEKFGVASLAVGLFQANEIGLYLAIACLLLSLLLTVEDKS